jgi:8-oxo-dGTP diphosphatase
VLLPLAEQRYIHVVAGALCDKGSVLIAQRPPGKHMAGGWEFPGGKIGSGEGSIHALKRELKEELNIDVHSAEWLCECAHDYPDRRVLLELWLVTKFQGMPVSNEGQAIKWTSIDTLHDVGMLPADEPLVKALQRWHISRAT